MERVQNTKRRRRRGCLFTTAVALIAVLLVGAVGFGILAWRDIHGSGEDKNYVVEIPDGAGTATIANILRNRGIIHLPAVFRLYVRSGEIPVYQKGKHTINDSMSYAEILAKLETAPDVESVGTKKVVIPEGYELRQIVDLLVETGLGDRETFMKEIEQGAFAYSFIDRIPDRENRLEGYLYPDTYLFSTEETEHQIIDKMLSAFHEKALPLYESVSTPYSLDQILILASVIEREAANDEERPLVASVFYNRIDKGMKLESCATVQYILKERKEILSNEDTAIDSPYNTYKYKGLPAGPIASPGTASIEAALQPAETDYLYFVATADGSANLFSKTFEEHNQKTIETQS